MKLELKNKHVTLVGLGRSSVAAAQLMQREGAYPFISEMNEGRPLDFWSEQCRKLGITVETGGHSPTAFEGADVIVLSPGVPANAACLDIPRRRSVPVLGELELASRYCPATFLAVTGTNGKTTTTELIRAMIAACDRTVALAGNNDTPLSLVALEPEPPEFVVLEVSSYQLETADTFHPHVAAVLNVTPDHLSRHGDMAAYAATKARIFQRQTGADWAVLNADCPVAAALPTSAAAAHAHFSLVSPQTKGFHIDGDAICRDGSPVARVSDNPLPGRHNLANALAALTVVQCAGLPLEGALDGLRSFPGVEHRIEHVLHLDGVDYYNDSKSTNVDSLRVALESFDRPVVLLAGGRGKGSDYRVLEELARTRVKAIIAFGEDAPLLEAAFRDVTQVSRAASMMDAVRRAREAAGSGDVALLSPACASFDMYDNFEERGRDFKDCVLRLAQQ